MKAYGIRMVLAAALAGALIAGVLIWRSHLQARAAADNCTSTHKLVSTLQQIVIGGASEGALRKFGYYREHPDEIKSARDNARATAAQLGTADCPPVPLPKEAP